MKEANGKLRNSWVAEGLKASRRNKVELATLLGIDPSGVTRILAGTRALKDYEANQIRDWFRRFGANVTEKSRIGNDKASTPVVLSPVVDGGTNDTEGGMHGGLWEIIGDLTRRVAALERTKEAEEKEPAKGPQNRRKR